MRELQAIENWRKKKGLSQEAVARKLGVSLITYNRWIRQNVGVGNLSDLSVAKIRRLWGQIKGGRARW